MNDTPIYDQTFSDHQDHAIETGNDYIFDELEAMDRNTTPGPPSEMPLSIS